jgi:hypothetical protein
VSLDCPSLYIMACSLPPLVQLTIHSREIEAVREYVGNSHIAATYSEEARLQVSQGHATSGSNSLDVRAQRSSPCHVNEESEHRVQYHPSPRCDERLSMFDRLYPAHGEQKPHPTVTSESSVDMDSDFRLPPITTEAYYWKSYTQKPCWDVVEIGDWEGEDKARDFCPKTSPNLILYHISDQIQVRRQKPSLRVRLCTCIIYT